MTASEFTNWQDLQAEILSRIHSRKWKPGELIPNEVDLADEFTRMIVTQRAFSANTKIITTADEMLAELTNIIR